MSAQHIIYIGILACICIIIAQHQIKNGLGFVSSVINKLLQFELIYYFILQSKICIKHAKLYVYTYIWLYDGVCKCFPYILIYV